MWKASASHHHFGLKSGKSHRRPRYNSAASFMIHLFQAGALLADVSPEWLFISTEGSGGRRTLPKMGRVKEDDLRQSSLCNRQDLRIRLVNYPLPSNLAGVFPGIKVHNGFLKAILEVTTEADSPQNNIGALIANLSAGVTPQTVGLSQFYPCLL